LSVVAGLPNSKKTTTGQSKLAPPPHPMSRQATMPTALTVVGLAWALHSRVFVQVAFFLTAQLYIFIYEIEVLTKHRY
jgi:hypothetical protein